MRIRYLFGILLVSAFAATSVPLPSALISLPGAAFLTPTAQAAQDEDPQPARPRARQIDARRDLQDEWSH
jgi:hypothetical protein